MRALVFSAYRAADTDRLGQTLDVEHSHVRFLGNLVLNLWDCGGQKSYMDSYLDSQRHQVFSAVGVLIYVFDLVGEDSEEWEKDVRSYKDCLSALRDNSPDAHVFCLLHKMDLVDASRRHSVYASRVEELRKKSEGLAINCFATSIWDETIYKVGLIMTC
jgi:Ras-related GTP-binding protein A/B